MANVTGGDEQTYSRRGPASRYYQEQRQGLFGDFLNRIQGMGQGMAQAVGLGAEANLDPRITGNYAPEGGNVTTGGGGRGSGAGSGRVTGGGGGGGGTALVTGAPGGGGQVPNAQLRNALFDRRNLFGGALALPAVGFAVQELIEGRPLSAAAGAAGAYGAGKVTAALTGGLRASPNPIAKAAGYLIPVGAAAAGTGLGDVAEKAKVSGKLPFGIGKGEAIAGKEGGLSEQLAQAEKVAETLANMDARTAQVYLQYHKQLARDATDLDFENTKRMMPLVEQAKRNELVRQQALIASMGQNYAMLGTVATAGKLALGSQEEQGLNLRTALTANPYANSVLQAPSISF